MKRNVFLNYAELLKSFGYRVFVNDESEYGNFNYGYYTNGRQVAHFFSGDYGGIRFGVEYHNEIEKDYRSVVDTWDEAVCEITKEIAEKKLLRHPWCTYLTQEENLRMQPWNSFDEWAKRHTLKGLHEI